MGFRGPNPYAGVAGADLENAPSGPVPFTSPFALPVTRMVTWHAGGVNPGGNTQGVPGKPVQRASGNPDVSTVPSWGPVKNPYGGADTPYDIPQFGRPRVLGVQQESYRGNNPAGGGRRENDKLITADRHAFLKVGYENSGRDSGETDPPMDGPARPSLAIVNRTINYQQGTDATAATDDLTRDYTRSTYADNGDDTFDTRFRQYQGRDGLPYVGEQGTGWSPIYGGVPGLYQPYGSYEGIGNQAGPQGIQSPVPQGAAGDGPRKVWGGPPHGLHSPTLPDYSQTLGRYMAIPQQVAPRIDRPSNSPIAGQSYSQTVQPQGQTGTAAQTTTINSGVNFNQRMRGNGWRGRG